MSPFAIVCLKHFMPLCTYSSHFSQEADVPGLRHSQVLGVVPSRNWPLRYMHKLLGVRGEGGKPRLVDLELVAFSCPGSLTDMSRPA